MPEEELSRMARHAGTLSSNVLMGIPGNKQMVCSHLYREYGINVSSSRTYAAIWDRDLVPVYGLELLARISITEMRKQIPDDAFGLLRRVYEDRRVLSEEEHNGLVEKYGQKNPYGNPPFMMAPRFLDPLLQSNPRFPSVKEWTEFARFFFDFVDSAMPVTDAEARDQFLRWRGQESDAAIQPENPPGTVGIVPATPIGSVPFQTPMTLTARPLSWGDLEALYEELLKRQGYMTQRHPLIAAAGGEIDVMGTRGNEAIIAECKNWAGQVGKVDANTMRVFCSKAEEAKENPVLRNKHRSYAVGYKFPS